VVDEQQPAGGSGISGLIDTIKAKPALFGGVGVLVVAAIVMIIVLAGGGDDDPEATADPGATTTAGPAGGEPAPGVTVAPGGATAADTTTAPDAADPPQAAPVDRNPLNGEVLATPSTDRVVAVKVDNAPEAGPPIAIQEAELVIEAPVEGGLTRLTAMFFANEPQVIGPIRSVRPVDADLLAPWKPFLVTTGGQSFVYREIKAAGIDILDDGTDGLFQQTERRAPYHLVATIPLIELEAGEGAPPVAVLPFGDAELGGTAASSIAIPFSGVADVAWDYDDAAGTYTRTVGGEAYQIYPEFGAELTGFGTDTVIVMKAAQRSAGYQDSAGAEVPTFDVIGFGEIMVFHGGEVRSGQWLRSAQSDGWVFLDDSGAQFTIPAGRVWLEIVPRFVEVTVE
jgi:hypothetical protein